MTGGSFIFVKLIKTEVPQYATSKMFAIRNPGNELFDVLSILKRLSKIVINRHLQKRENREHETWNSEE
ncbi:hypothetical protein [Okeania sp. SIO1I7]|uniref:hypothetical protein n=1 Tax=Okeania sp. SIO1I7 TaxID=2607772 RepID=UPI0034547BE9